jgi:hypothetical protein
MKGATGAGISSERDDARPSPLCLDFLRVAKVEPEERMAIKREASSRSAPPPAATAAASVHVRAAEPDRSRGHCGIWAKGVADEWLGGACSPQEGCKKYSQRLILDVVRGV